METKAHHALVGFFIVAFVGAGAFFALWLGQVSLDREFKEYDIIFEGPVRGLRPASGVSFNGIQVGEVTELSLDPQNTNQVIARVRINADTPVKADSTAQLEPQGLTGLSFIQISGGSPGADPLESRMGDTPPRILADQAQLDQLFAGGETVIEGAERALNQINQVLSDENIESLSNTLNHIEDLSAALASDDQLIADMRSAVANLDQAAQDISGAAGALEEFGRTAEVFLLDEVGPMVEAVDAASRDLELASEEAFEGVAAIRPSLETFAEEGLNDLTAAAQDLRRLVEVLERIALELEENPAGFLSSPSGEAVELPQ